MATVVTLIHGTWAQSAAWTQEGSTLRTSLTHAFGNSVTFRTFPWTARNSFGARSKAAKELRGFLTEGFALRPTDRHAIVAHSHGGNIALYTLRDENLAKSVDSVVCLSTPFIAAHPRKFGFSSDVATSLAVGIISFLLGLAIGGRVAYAMPTAQPKFLAIVFILLTTTIMWLSWSTMNRVGHAWYRYAQAWAAEVAVAAPKSGPRLLVIRPTADEASEGIAAFHFPIVLMMWAWKALASISLMPMTIAAIMDVWADRWYKRLPISVCLWLATMWTIAYLNPGAPHDKFVQLAIYMGGILFLVAMSSRGMDLLQLVAFLSMPIIATIGFLFVGFLLFFSIATVPFNSSPRDLPSFLSTGIWLGPIDVAAESVPTGENVTVRRLPDDADGLRHSSTYEDPKSIEWIIEWIGPNT